MKPAEETLMRSSATATTTETGIDCGDTEDFRVAVFARMSDPHLLATMLCHVLHIKLLDAAIAARRTPGVLSLPMNVDRADTLVAALRNIGITAAAVEAADLPDLSQAEVVHHARLLDEGLEILDLHGNRAELLPWSRIGVVAIGSIPGEATSRYIELGRPSVVSAAPLPEVAHVRTTDHDTLEMWLMDRVSRAAYRLRHDRFNYECLGAAKTGSATTNFDRFAEGVMDRATSARRTPSTHAYCAQETAKYQFACSEDLQQQALLAWILDRSSLHNSQEHGQSHR
jgi:hypothetical protein